MRALIPGVAWLVVAALSFGFLTAAAHARRASKERISVPAVESVSVAPERDADGAASGATAKASVRPSARRHLVLASWYGHPHQGRRTASGTRFDMHAMTAAHRSLPFGTAVRVRSVATGRSVVVTINDRGPYVGDRALDLSYAAAKALGIAERGVAKVVMQVLPPEDVGDTIARMRMHRPSVLLEAGREICDTPTFGFG